MSTWGRRGRDRIVVGFTTTCCMWQFKYQVISNDNFFFTYQVEPISNNTIWFHVIPIFLDLDRPDMLIFKNNY